MAIQINGDGTITGVSVGGLPDGIVDTDMLANNAVTSAKASGISGLSMVDQWRITAQYQVSDFSYITSNWERNDHSSFGLLGTGMSESSGEFSFPSTGIYVVRIVISWFPSGGGTNYNRVAIYTTTDNSTYDDAAMGWSGVESANQYNQSSAEIIFDVTNTSTHKVKFQTGASNTRPRVRGETDYNASYATFIRLGDT